MTLKSYLSDLYGGRIYHLTTALKNVKCKLARLTNHIIFLTRCRDNKLVPKGMQLRHTVTSPKAGDIIKRAEDGLVRDQITSLKKKKAIELKTKDRLIMSLRSVVSSGDFRVVQNVTNKAENGEFQRMKDIQKKKFASLRNARDNRNKHRQDVAITAVDNRSGCHLSTDEQKVLEKGLGFAPTPQAVPVKEIICAVEAGLSKVTDVTQANVIRSQVSSIVNKAKVKPIADNMTAAERIALNRLSKRTDIKILPADKGNTTVVLSAQQYSEKMNQLLDDPGYIKINKDPTAVKERQIRKAIDEVCRSGSISEGLAKRLKPSHSTPPRLYGVPKIHKNGVPLRPITSMIGSPAYELAAHLTKIISPVLGKTEYTVSNSKSFVEEIRNLTLDETEEMVSFDVVSLFTKVPVEDAVNVICSHLTADDSLQDRTGLSVEQIRWLMLACLNCRYFLCQGSFYEQTEGAPMGLSLSVVLANAYMEHLEESVLGAASVQPVIWRRYVDDTFILWKHGDEALEQFHRELNGFCPAIQFTMEREQDRKLPFLDVLVCRDRARLKTSVYSKPTASNLYLKYDSNHPASMKAGIVRCLNARAQAVCSEPASLHEERVHLSDIFQCNGYPRSFIDRSIKKRKHVRQQAEETSQEKTFIKLPYVRGVSEKLAKIFRPMGIQVAHSSNRLRNRLVKAKDAVKPEKKKGAVYQISCSCGSVYIGESGRPKDVRLKEHVADIKHARLDKSATARHFSTCRGDLNPLAAKTLATEGHWKRRKVREAIEVKLTPQATMNLDEGGVRLSPIWDILLT